MDRLCWVWVLGEAGFSTAADHKLGKEKRPRLRAGDGKNPPGYRALARLYNKRKIVLLHKNHNPSLDRFVDAIERFGGGGES